MGAINECDQAASFPIDSRAKEGEKYLNEKLGNRISASGNGADIWDYWELSTGWSFNLNPMFAFVDGRWKVRGKKSSPWIDAENAAPASGKGAAATQEILNKLSEINRKLP